MNSLLVANRGEIARRIFRTCHEMGISTVAVFVGDDTHHVSGTAVAISSYLDAGEIVRAALEAGVDAVHPGYGFLSENAAFAQAVLDAGLIWVGPPPSAIEAMGSKIEAKKIMSTAGVPVLSETYDALPLLIKASAGGGGRGMRIVRELSELDDALRSARAEAQSAFGDPTVFCEPYIENGRHIEVQILADQHGVVQAIGERECSIQRRHQKVIEEAPCGRPDLAAAAIAAAKAVGYVGAGTVEFLVAPDRSFHFLEMNTRLQVEHPVTELVYGLDLVRAQLEIADGLPLGEQPISRGHAIEARLYAEDPSADWLPSSGVLHALEFPAGVRVDAGYDGGSTVGVLYDPMLAKVIAHAPTRTEAARKLAAALANARVHGLVTNRDLLVNVLRHPSFLAGDTTTAFLTLHDVTEPLASAETRRLSAIAAALALAAASDRRPWRNLASASQRKSFSDVDVDYRYERNRWVVEGVHVVSVSPTTVVLGERVRHTFGVAAYGSLIEVDSALGPVQLNLLPRFPVPQTQLAAGSLVAPMPGVVARVAVAVGDTVAIGQPLLWIEAMKMEHQLNAPIAGVVTSLAVTAGAQVESGVLLAVVARAAEPPSGVHVAEESS